MSEPRGIFAPIEGVIADAERRAQVLHDRATQPCPHEVTEKRLCDQYSHCAECGAEVVE